jgi:hypothetical protein
MPRANNVDGVVGRVVAAVIDILFTERGKLMVEPMGDIAC